MVKFHGAKVHIFLNLTRFFYETAAFFSICGNNTVYLH